MDYCLLSKRYEDHSSSLSALEDHPTVTRPVVLVSRTASHESVFLVAGHYESLGRSTEGHG